MNQRSLRYTVQSIGLALLFSMLGFLVRLLLSVLLDVDLPLWVASVLNFALAALGAFVFFPRVLKRPFGEVALSEYVRRLGFYLPRHAWRHVVLGGILALCTLGGMLVSSLLTGRYVLDWRTVDLSHVVFSLNAGVWEEFFFRGLIAIVLLQYTRSVKKTVVIQIVLFGLSHIKGIDLWSWVDVFSVVVIATAFVYAAYKTRTLLAGIVFHFVHDALLFLVQVPDEYVGVGENVIFYLALWSMVGVACLLIKVAAEKLGVQAEAELYAVEEAPQAPIQADAAG